MRNKLGYKVACHAKKRKKEIERNVTMGQEKERKRKKEDQVNEKREITIEGEEKMEKAKQLMEGTYKWKGKYKKTQKKLNTE